MIVVFKPRYRPLPTVETPVIYEGLMIGKIILVDARSGEVYADIQEEYKTLFETEVSNSMEIMKGEAL